MKFTDASSTGWTLKVICSPDDKRDVAALITFDNTRAQLSRLTPEQEKLVREATTVYAPGYRYAPLYKKRDSKGNRVWDGKVRALSRELYFDAGFVPFVAALLGEVQLDDRRYLKQLRAKTDIDHGLRDYQFEALMKALGTTYMGMWWPRGVIQIPTGGGKTKLAAAMIRVTRGVRTIFIVPSADLVDQTREEFQDNGIDTGTVEESEIIGSRDVVVCTVQSLMWWAMGSPATPKEDESPEEFQERALLRAAELAERRARGEEIRRYLSSVEQAFIDEAHSAAANDQNKGNLFVQAMRLMNCAYMRWGLSATPFMREEYHNWLLEGVAGQLLFKISTKQLVDAGILARPKITMVRCRPLVIPEKWETATELGIVMNNARNEKVVDILQQAPGGLAAALIQEVSHGRIIESICVGRGMHVEYLYGPISKRRRKEVWEAFTANEIHAVIASRIGDQGLNIPAIKTLVIAGGGKSKVKTIQRLGRALRRTSTKTEVYVWDFIDVATPHLYRHSMARRKTYLDEGHDVTECEL